MYYRINVAKLTKTAAQSWNGKSPEYAHFFATADHSCRDRADMLAVYGELVKAFPSPTYRIEVSHWVEQGSIIDMQAASARTS